MNSDSENFDSLRKLLALKRHEQPPPGYFNRFSRDVISRIRAGEEGGVVGLGLNWWERLAGVFDLKPVFAGAFGMGVCALLVSGVVASEHATGPIPVGSIFGKSGSADFVATPVIDQQVLAGTFGTNPVAPSLFDQYQAQNQLHGSLVSDRYLIPNGN